MTGMTCGLAAALLLAPILRTGGDERPRDVGGTAAKAPGAAGVPGEDGWTVFRMNCAVCHGTSARGDGPLADALRFRPADLTLIAKHNRGKFPTPTVRRIIDGREPVKGHGGTDMPVWGDAFKRSAGGFSDEAVKLRIDAIVAHLKSIQVR